MSSEDVGMWALIKTEGGRLLGMRGKDGVGWGGQGAETSGESKVVGRNAWKGVRTVKK